MAWLTGNQRNLTARFGDRILWRRFRGFRIGDRVTALIPLDEVSARAISSSVVVRCRISLRRTVAAKAEGRPGTILEISTAERGQRNSPSTVGRCLEDDLWPALDGTGRVVVCADRWIVWFRVDRRHGRSGERRTVRGRQSAGAAPDLSGQRLGTISPFHAMSSDADSGALSPVLRRFFSIGYGLALAAAAAVVFSIARSTSRLTQGARQVERGNLDHRVPVKRQDQLGDLARSFNHMTDSVQYMLVGRGRERAVGPRARVGAGDPAEPAAGPPPRVGAASVRATFQPAAEVGGDYFDVFSLLTIASW